MFRATQATGCASPLSSRRFGKRRPRRKSFWSDDACTEIDFQKYILVKLYRTDFVDFCQKHDPERIHVMVPEKLAATIPSFVFSFLSRGSKYIQDFGGHHVKDLAVAFDSCKNQLDKAFFFHGKDGGDFKRRRCAVPSSWKPPSDTQAGLFRRLLEEDTNVYETIKPGRNYSHYDGKARAWLRRAAGDLLI